MMVRESLARWVLEPLSLRLIVRFKDVAVPFDSLGERLTIVRAAPWSVQGCRSWESLTCPRQRLPLTLTR